MRKKSDIKDYIAYVSIYMKSQRQIYYDRNQNSSCLRLGMGNGCKVAHGSDKNVLKLDCGNNYTTLCIH